jgi:adenylate cyclase
MNSPADFPPDRLCYGACVITDAERYTSVAESVDPAEAVEFINRYLEVLFKPVYDNGGIVADVKGDGMLAVWAESSPSAELRARVCRACLQIAADSDRFFPTRIGAYYGPIALASVGTDAHREYRAVGDTVNTASRLETLNKQLGTRVLISASLADGLGGFRFRDLGEVELRGKRNPVHVLELLDALKPAPQRRARLVELDLQPRCA